MYYEYCLVVENYANPAKLLRHNKAHLSFFYSRLWIIGAKAPSAVLNQLGSNKLSFKFGVENF